MRASSSRSSWAARVPAGQAMRWRRNGWGKRKGAAAPFSIRSSIQSVQTKKNPEAETSGFFSTNLVGVQGFEPWTPWSQTRCATGLRHTPKTKIIQTVSTSVKGQVKLCVNYLRAEQQLMYF